MVNKYFTVEVKPTIAASKQHAGGFTAGLVMWDWLAVQVPKGSSNLIGASLLTRPKGDAGPTANNFPMDLIFSKTNTVSLGTAGAALNNRPTNDLLGLIEFAAGNFGASSMPSTNIATTGWGSSIGAPPIVITPDPTTGDNVGYDTIYVAGVSRHANWDFQSILVVSDADIASAAHTSIVTAGSSMDNREHFIAGDVIHAQDDAVVGTLASVAESGITLTSELGTSVLTNGDTLYNINPIRAILYFEK
tara:strand:+ start:189 stop:932 length:744 start_codon:yes stop_codon:yes gene_type:complete